ncbi:hypothetical protein WA588_002894, partial [Blastocystis sp. NMH]
MCALEAIYAENFVKLSDNSFKILIPNDAGRSDLELIIHYRNTYPSLIYPLFDVYAEWLSDSQIDSIKDSLIQQFADNVGQVVVYNWVEWLRENVHPHAIRPEDTPKPAKESPVAEEVHTEPILSKANVVPEPLPEKEFMSGASKDGFVKPPKCPDVFSDEPFTDRKSTFQAHCAEVHSEEEVKLVLQYLHTNNKIQRATHNMYAYRIYDEERGIWFQDNDDDGESAAGSRMLHLMCMMDVKNVMVVVSRWWGGILLGPDRFKHINNATRNVLEKCGFVDAQHTKKG